MPHFTYLNIILDKNSLKIHKDGYRLLPSAEEALADLVASVRWTGMDKAFSRQRDVCNFSSDDAALIGAKLYDRYGQASEIGEKEQVSEDLHLAGFVEEFYTRDFPKDVMQNPEFHIHFDVHGWYDNEGKFSKGIPRSLETDLRGVVHMDSFNPFYTVLTANGEMMAADLYRETPYLLTSGLTCKKMQATPEEARMAKIGFDELNRKIVEIEKKHNIRLVGYTELELIAVVRKFPDVPLNEEHFVYFFTEEGDAVKSHLGLEKKDLESGFKSCEFHFKLGKNYDPRILKGLIDIGLINAAMPPENGKFTPYFTMQGRNVEVRDQLATYITILARKAGGFGQGARIQLETIVAHEFYGQEFAPNRHLPQIVTGLTLQNEKAAPFFNLVRNEASQQLVTNEEGKTIAIAALETQIAESYRLGLDLLRHRLPTALEIAETVARLDSWDDNPAPLVNAPVLPPRGAIKNRS